MSKLITHIKRLALALCLATPIVSWAAVTNPVTGEEETYSNTFTGETAEWNEASNWTSEEVPFVSGGNYNSALVSDKTVSTETDIDGWNLKVGAYNGASITWKKLVKIQGDTGMWLTVDDSSTITINGWGGGNLGNNQTLKYYVANKNGVTWATDLASSGQETLTMNYYLAGEGSVAYQKLERATQVIKQADVSLSGTKEVKSKTLVSFTSTTKTFTADAAIKIKDGDNDLKTVYLTSVTASDTTLTTEDAVGTCELVQKEDGVYLYYVDGNPADVVVEEKTYKPSISINFTNGAGNGLTTGADVGLEGYAVPGTSWNNYVVGNSTFSTVNAIDSTGAASAMSGVSVTISGTRGSYSCSNLTPASNPLHGYIDENDGNPAPTVTVTGIPYYKYRVLVYHSTDTENAQFNYDTINGANYTYVENVLSDGTTAWGNAGAQDSANAIAEGGNVLVTEALSGSTLTVVGHRSSGSVRGCIAAIQIIEVKADVGENDLEIAVDGEREYTVTAEDAEKTGTVYLTGSGTVTLAGEAKISAATIDVGDLVTLVVNADRLDATTFIGGGTVVYDGTKPVTNKGWTDSENWSGTVWVKNISTDSNERKDWDLALYGNANSTLRFTNVNLFFKNATDNVFPGTVDIDGDGMNVCDGYGSTQATFTRLTGSGTLSTTGGSSYGNGLTINDASGFTGTITLTKYKVTVGTSTGKSANGILEIESGKSITVAGATAPGGFVVNGTLVANGTLASSAAAAVTGSGTVTFGGVPSPVDGENETKWWKNAGWTGTVEIKGASIAGNTYAFNDYGNATSTVKLTNCSGWLTGGYTCVPALEIGGTFTWNDGWSGLNNTFKVGTLKGSGTISIPNQGAPTAVWQITDDWSGFTGAVVGNNNAAQRVLVFGSTLPTSIVKGEIYVSEGATLDLDNASGAWWGVGMGFVIDGTVKASSRSKWGGGTYMKLGDTGVLEFVSTSNTDDQNTEMGNITGTGTLKFSSTAGWRAFPKTDANMPATTLTIQTELADSLILPTKNDGETVIGNLAGSKNIRSDWSDTGANGRILTVTQSKDTEWQGKFVSNRTTQFNVVAPAEGTPGTLTLSGTQSASVPMQVNGSVNLTGTWKGATTVAGKIGGTGTIAGDLTFSDGATFKANASALTVSGTVTLGESLTIDATGLTADEVTVLSSESITAETDVSKVAVNGLYTVTPVAGALKLVTTKVEVTVPVVDNTTVTVAVGGETIGTTSGTYKVAPDSVVTVTYAAAAGYEISGTTEYTINVANSETTFQPTETTVKQYVAKIDGGSSYTSLQAAFDAVSNGKKLVLLASTEDGAVVPSNAMAFHFYAGEFECGEIADATGDFVTTRTEDTITIGEDFVKAIKIRVAAVVAVVTLPNEGGVTTYGDHMLAYNAFLAGPAGTTLRVIGTNSFSTDISCTTYDSNSQTYTKLVAYASITDGSFTTNYPTVTEALAAATEGQTVKVIADYTNASGEAAVFAKEYAVTLDLNGCTITGTDGVRLNAAGPLTITDSSTNASGKVVATADDGVALWARNGSAIVNAGTFQNNSISEATVYVGYKDAPQYDNQTVIINGGTFVNLAQAYKYDTSGNGTYSYYALNVLNTFPVAAIQVSAGSFSYDPAKGDDNQGGTFVKSGYASTETSTGVWTVTEVTNPTIDGQPVDPAAVFDTATSAKGITYPTAPTVSGEAGSQTITYKDTEVNVPAYYTASLSGTTVTLTLNSNALPTVGATEASGDDEAVPATEVTDETFGLGLTTTSAKLYYGLATCDTPSGTFADPTTLTKGTGKAMSLTATRGENETVKFYKVFVTDIAPVTP